jgi:hypothetical protein
VGTSEITDGSVASADLGSNLALSGTDSVTVPKGTTAQRGTGVDGKFRFNTTTNSFEGYSNSAWGSIGGGATGGGTDAVFYENDQTVTTNYTITANQNAMAAGVVTINSGVVLTVPSGARLVVV